MCLPCSFWTNNVYSRTIKSDKRKKTSLLKDFLIKVRSNFLKLILYFLVLRISFIFQLETWRIDTNCIGYFAWSFRLFQTIRSGQTRKDPFLSEAESALSPGKQWMIEYCHHFKGCLFLHLINLQTDRSKSTYENWIFSNVKSFSEMQPSEYFSLVLTSIIFYWIEF